MAKTIDKVRHYGNNNHLFQTRSSCGMPSEMWEVMIADGKKECPECFSLKSKKKICLRCDKSFQPGCKSSHICGICLSWNRQSDEQETYKL